MSRVFKFRAWHKRSTTMLCDIHNEPNEQSDAYTFGDYIDDKDNYHVMQFTGLLDKDGKEIYEGDVIVHNDHTVTFIVKWCDGKGEYLGSQVGWILDNGYYAEELKANQSNSPDRDNSDDFAPVAVLGNIYQNPDLLKGMGSFGYDPLTGERKV